MVTQNSKKNIGTTNGLIKILKNTETTPKHFGNLELVDNLV